MDGYCETGKSMRVCERVCVWLMWARVSAVFGCCFWLLCSVTECVCVFGCIFWVSARASLWVVLGVTVRTSQQPWESPIFSELHQVLCDLAEGGLSKLLFVPVVPTDPLVVYKLRLNSLGPLNDLMWLAFPGWQVFIWLNFNLLL